MEPLKTQTSDSLTLWSCRCSTPASADSCCCRWGQKRGQRQYFHHQNDSKACHRRANLNSEQTNPNQSQGRSSESCQPPYQHKKETDSSPEDEEVNHPNHIQQQWRKKQKE